jgi:DNA-binding MarR family transcriptional regulator
MTKKNKHVSAVLVAMNIIIETKQRLSTPLKKANLSFNEWTVLQTIYFNYADTPSKIARHLNIQKASTTRIIDSLEKKKCITRTYLDTDRRSINIKIAKKGTSLSESILAHYPDISERLQLNLDGEERKLWGSMMGGKYAKV